MVNHRPLYHYTAPAYWMNDPNGLIQHQGVYHLFYQHNPGAAVWGNMHWGHAASRDLAHWQHLPIALAPTPGGPDESGVWSGCIVDLDGQPTAVYTGQTGLSETVCLAAGRDNLAAWEKHPRNPVISRPPAGLDTVGFRDPYVWREGGTWNMVIGSGLRDRGGMVLRYTSPDLLNWRFEGPLLTGDASRHEPVWTGEMWECPNFFPLGDEHVLIVSPMALYPSRSLYTLYFIGAYDGGTFRPSTVAKMDGGDLYFYAPQAFQDEQGRRIVMGWSREARSERAVVQEGWAGVMTLPRVLSLRADGQMTQQPAPELELLRGEERAWKDIALAPGLDPLAVEGLSGDTLEMEVVFHLGAARDDRDGELGLLVRRSPDGEEVTTIRVDLATETLVVDTLRSSLSSEDWPGEYEIPVDLSGANLLSLRVFLDRSIIEVYANEVAVITARVYPTRADATGIAFTAARRPGLIASLRVWEMGSAFEESSGRQRT